MSKAEIDKAMYALLFERRIGNHKLPNNIQFHITHGGQVKTTIMPMFLHLREHTVIAYDPDTNEAILDVSPKGGCTVAFTYEPNFVKYAVAYCNIKDHYNKHIGRVKASGRLQSRNQHKTFEVEEDATVSQVIEQIKERIYRDKQQYDDSYRTYVF